MQLKKLDSTTRHSTESGNIAISLIAVVMVSAALLATLTRAWTGAASVARRDLANSARDAAEAGSESILSELNSDYPHLLVANNANWCGLKTSSTLCSSSSALDCGDEGDVNPLAESVDIGDSSYQLEEYQFNGNSIFGGTAYLRVKGTSQNSNNSASATAVVEKKIQIIPKFCDEPFNDPKGFPVLMARECNLGNNDIRGDEGLVLCALDTDNIPNNCDPDEDTSLADYTKADKICVLGGGNNTTVDGDISIGLPNFEGHLTLPSSLDSVTAARINRNNGKTTISESNLLGGACIIETDVTLQTDVIHCKIDRITLRSSGKLEVDTDNYPVRLYVSGDITLSGNNSKIYQKDSDQPATRLAIFGNEIDPNVPNQSVTLSGKSQIDNAWLFFPDGTVGINGGANNPSCAGGVCTGGDIHGPVWADIFNGSNSNKAEITVPEDLADNEDYPGIKSGTPSFVGAGVLSFKMFKVGSQG